MRTLKKSKHNMKNSLGLRHNQKLHANTDSYYDPADHNNIAGKKVSILSPIQAKVRK